MKCCEYAAGEGHLPAVQFLIKKGAHIDSKKNFGETALHEAAKHGHLPIVQFLVQKGAQVMDDLIKLVCDVIYTSD